jgi:hypothetical protein
MKEAHTHGVEQRPLKGAQDRTDQFRPWSCTKPLGADESKRTFNSVQEVTSSLGSIAQVRAACCGRVAPTARKDARNLLR